MGSSGRPFSSAGHFAAWDYAWPAALLLVSLLLGFVSSWLRRRPSLSRQDTEELPKPGLCHPSPPDETNIYNQDVDFFSGGRQLSWVPVALSLSASVVSGYTNIGVPAEVFDWGLGIWLFQIMAVPAVLVSNWVLVAFLRRLPQLSILAYFRQRWPGGSAARLVATAAFLCHSIWYAAVAIHAPAAALTRAETGSDTSSSTTLMIFLVAAVCVAYTALGIRAVVWADALQALVMLAALLTVVLKATYRAGGLGPVFETANAYELHMPLLNLDPDPRQRSNLWMILVSGLLFWLSLGALYQPSVQRFSAVRTLREARWAMAAGTLFSVALQSLCALLGLLMRQRLRERPDVVAGSDGRLVIGFVLETLDGPWDLRGLFLAGLLGGTLSTVSTCLHSSATVIWSEVRLQLFDAARYRRFKKELDKLASPLPVLAPSWEQGARARAQAMALRKRDRAIARLSEDDAAKDPSDGKGERRSRHQQRQSDAPKSTCGRIISSYWRFVERLRRQVERLRSCSGDEALLLCEQHATLFGQLFVLLLGLASTGLACLVPQFGGTLPTGMWSLGTFGGVIVGLFLLGLLFPRALHASAFAAALIVGGGMTLNFVLASFGLTEKLSTFLVSTVSTLGVVGLGLALSEIQRCVMPKRANEADAKLRRAEERLEAKNERGGVSSELDEQMDPDHKVEIFLSVPTIIRFRMPAFLHRICSARKARASIEPVRPIRMTHRPRTL